MNWFPYDNGLHHERVKRCKNNVDLSTIFLSTKWRRCSDVLITTSFCQQYSNIFLTSCLQRRFINNITTSLGHLLTSLVFTTLLQRHGMVERRCDVKTTIMQRCQHVVCLLDGLNYVDFSYQSFATVNPFMLFPFSSKFHTIRKVYLEPKQTSPMERYHWRRNRDLPAKYLECWSYSKFTEIFNKNDFMRQVFINNNIVRILFDTAAKVSVCSVKEAKQWGLLDRLQPSQVKIHSNNSQPTSVKGTFKWSWMTHDIHLTEARWA